MHTGVLQLHVCQASPAPKLPKGPRRLCNDCWYACRFSSAAVAAIGLTNMLNAGGSVTHLEMGASTSESTSLIARIGVQGYGSFLAYASVKPQAVCVNGKEVHFSWDEGQGTVRVEVPVSESLKSEVDLMLP